MMLSIKRASVQLRGFTLAEAAISTAIVGVMLAGALTCVAKTGAFRRVANEQQVAYHLAEQLMSEILAKSYSDRSASWPTAIGPTSYERSVGNRSAFDDVDDYHGWIESPPESANGTDLVIGTDWYRKVEVSFVYWADLNSTVSTDYGLKRISVEVGRVRPGGNASVAADRRPVTSLVGIAGRGRGL